METKRTIGIALACLTGAVSFSGGATAGILTGRVQTPIPSAPINLTAEGTLDWAQWGLGGNDPSVFNQKSGSTNQISNYTQIGDLSVGVNAYSGSGVSLEWSDGTPTAVAADGQFGIYVNGTNGNGFQITVPADTTTRFLNVYTGGWNERVRFNATLSDASAPAYTDGSLIDTNGSSVTGVYTIKFAANSSGKNLTITITAQNLYDINGNSTLEAATLFGQAPAIGGIQPASQTNWAGLTAQLTVQASSDPDAPVFYQWYKGTPGSSVSLADGGQIFGASTPTLTISNLVFGNATNFYLVVTNVYGAVTSSVATLTVLPITGTLVGAALPAPSTVDLTGEGMLDWAAWGLSVATDFDQKAGGTNQISNFTQIGGSAAAQYNNALVAFSWRDGTPDATAAGTTTGIYFSGIANGYEITVPADQTKRILRVYAGGWNTTVHFEAELSDQSAPFYVDESLVTPANSSLAAAYAIAYIGGSPNQKLTIRVYCVTDGGNVTLMAASLSGPSPNVLNAPSSQTNLLGYSAHFTVQAEGWLPLAYQWWRQSGSVYAPLSDGGQISGSMSNTLTISNLVFANATNYYVVVTNVYGAVTSSVASLSVLPPTGTMMGEISTNISSLTVVDLTAEGTLDWADWGLANLLDFNDKAVGGAPVGLIGNWTVYGPVNYGPTLDNFGDQPYGLSWTDGTPTATATTTGRGTANYVYVGSLASGFQIAVSADTTLEVLKLYYMGWSCRTRVMAALSDHSAPAFINDSVDDPGGNIAYGVATISFAAGSAGQTLTVTVYDVLDYKGGNVGITAATLALAPAQPPTLSYSFSGSSLQLSWPSSSMLLQATKVTGPWTTNAASGALTVAPSPAQPQMFYRLQVK